MQTFIFVCADYIDEIDYKNGDRDDGHDADHNDDDDGDYGHDYDDDYGMRMWKCLCGWG